jgi:transcription elongation factor Elf1
MASISHTATFRPDDPPARMHEDLRCPRCGHHELADAHTQITDGRVRIFCDCCGTVITISVTEAQAASLLSCLSARGSS